MKIKEIISDILYYLIIVFIGAGTIGFIWLSFMTFEMVLPKYIMENVILTNTIGLGTTLGIIILTIKMVITE